VLLVVPHERADAVAGFDPETPEADREPLDPFRDLGEGHVAAVVALEGDDLALTVQRPTVAEDHADVEREVLHGRLHHRTVLPIPNWSIPLCRPALRARLRCISIQVVETARSVLGSTTRFPGSTAVVHA